MYVRILFCMKRFVNVFLKLFENLFPCDLCKRAAINAGIIQIITKNKTYNLNEFEL